MNKYCAMLSRSVVSDSFETPWTVYSRLLCPQNSPVKNIGVGCHSLLQGNFSTQGLNPGLLHCRQVFFRCFVLFLFFFTIRVKYYRFGSVCRILLQWDICFISYTKLDQPREHIKKQRYYFANKGSPSKGYGFSSSHVWM